MAPSGTSRLLRGGLLILLLTAALSSAAQAQRPAGNTGGARREVVYDYTTGVNLNLYLLIPGNAECDLSDCERSAEARQETQQFAYDKAFERVDQSGRLYSKAKQDYFDAFEKLVEKQKGSQAILREDVRFLKAIETFDYRNQRYKFDVTLGVRLVPRLVPQLDQFFREALARAHVERSEDTIIFDLTRIFADISEDESFRRSLEELLKSEQLRQALRYKDDDTQAFIAQIRGFAVNQYSVNAVIGSIIERAVVPEIRKVLTTRRTVTVTCEGGADRLRFNGTLTYSGRGRVATKGTLLPLDSEEGRPLKDGIRDNLALSFARGYAGAKALAELLGDLSTNKRVLLRYTGLGEVADRAGNHPESRRIIFRLDLGPKLK